jgi:hypothetical protein
MRCFARAECTTLATSFGPPPRSVLDASDAGWCVVGVFPKSDDPVPLAEDEVAVWGPFESAEHAARFAATLTHVDGRRALVTVTRIRLAPPLGPRLVGT